jgi:hypothetical protein
MTAAEQLQPQQPYKYSMKVEVRAKGKLGTSVHAYGDNADEVRHELVEQYIKLQEDFKAKGKQVVGAADNGE